LPKRLNQERDRRTTSAWKKDRRPNIGPLEEPLKGEEQDEIGSAKQLISSGDGKKVGAGVKRNPFRLWTERWES